MNEKKRLYYLNQMGIQVWMSQMPGKDKIATNADNDCSDSARQESNDTLEKVSASDEYSASAESLQALKRIVATCTLCELHKTRTQTVFGTGSPTADWLIIGEAPGADEDRKGEPFVGRAGQLLTNMLRAIGLAREEVYIANILKCRPPKNRDPQQSEVACCRPYLQQQIDFIQPKIILALGRIAAQSLLNTDTPIGRMRGRKYTYEDTQIPVVATYHPAYLLRSPQQKRKAWEDLKFALQIKDLSS